MRSTNTPTPSETQRRRQVIRFLAAVLACGLCYAGLCIVLKFVVPCPFYTVTGLQCPGCGISRMCLSLLRLDVGAAWRYNAGLFALSPALAVLAVLTARRYIVHGTLTPTRPMRALTLFCIVWMLGWGIVRNLP